MADVSIEVDGQPSTQVAIREDQLVWQGKLSAEPVSVDVTYTAVGKGLYEMPISPGGILDEFSISLKANGSDIRFLDLSLQPTEQERADGSSIYRWKYAKLLLGRPIRLDVLGIAPIDRLGELTWLGPISVVLFGILVGLTVQAASATRFDIWMLLLTVGTFASSYPLMYFAQEYISLEVAMFASAGVAVAIIGLRALTLMKIYWAILGVIFPAVAILTLTLIAAINPPLQGIMLTIEIIGFFIGATMLMPRIHTTSSSFWGISHASVVVADEVEVEVEKKPEEK